MKNIFLCCFVLASLLTTAQQKPNIIFILADDLGYGELSCYGQEKIKTPHLDQMAKEGMRFTSFYSNPLCAPTRCSFITGLNTSHSQVRNNKEMGKFDGKNEFGQIPLSENTISIASLLKTAGYKTAIIGKWGLGGPGSSGVPNKQGFDFFYGYLDQQHAHNYYPEYLWRNDKKEFLGQPYFSAHQKLSGNENDPGSYKAFKGKVYSNDTMVKEAIRFIHEQKNDQPFFLYMAFTLPHLALQVPDEEVKNYIGRFDESPYKGEKGYLPQQYPRSAYAAMVSLLDKYTGRILDELKSSGLDKNTLVIFTGDNGSATKTGGADPEFFKVCGDLRNYKGSLYEGGIREPFIAWWPGKIKAGSINTDVFAVWDMLPTFCELAAVNSNYQSDGVSIRKALQGKKNKQHDFLYWEEHSYANGQQAIRWKNWKGYRSGLHKDPNAPIELYDLSKDIAEKENVAAQHPEIVKKIKKMMESRIASPVKEWNF